MSSPTPTGYAVRCRACPTCSTLNSVGPALIYLTEEEYYAQISRPDSFWICPNCGDSASWDDTNYEQWCEAEEFTAAVADELELSHDAEDNEKFKKAKMAIFKMMKVKEKFLTTSKRRD